MHSSYIYVHSSSNLINQLTHFYFVCQLARSFYILLLCLYKHRLRHHHHHHHHRHRHIFLLLIILLLVLFWFLLKSIDLHAFNSFFIIMIIIIIIAFELYSSSSCAPALALVLLYNVYLSYSAYTRTLARLLVRSLTQSNRYNKMIYRLDLSLSYSWCVRECV